jgi:hypothetical protein
VTNQVFPALIIASFHGLRLRCWAIVPVLHGVRRTLRQLRHAIRDTST